MKETEVERFPARSEDGEYETTIIVFQSFIDTATRAHPGAVAPGLRKARTIDGHACNRRADGTFEVVGDPIHPGVVLRRVE